MESVEVDLEFTSGGIVKKKGRHMEIREILKQVKTGEMSVKEAEQYLRREPFEEMGYAKLDVHRKLRSILGNPAPQVFYFLFHVCIFAKYALVHPQHSPSCTSLPDTPQPSCALSASLVPVSLLSPPSCYDVLCCPDAFLSWFSITVLLTPLYIHAFKNSCIFLVF